ncbi:hypothetical protein LTR37_016040 [Vermiconidia calcicola]|uniref:Uncharacterized protein n=1 Tax=Vermiconidia calcicola TaxID=1690605 RepID=A0ACC3MNZ8_9PEZI|nr:hypothetical protein LTR37_016040 [Vermiconidia calcicola]
MKLRHLHLPGLTHYTHASRLQHQLVSKLLAYKAKSNYSSPPPRPTIITAEFHPVYTCGRREVGNVSQEQIDYLTEEVPDLGKAEFHEALRGGQTTFHGPGQLVAYPILDLKCHGLTPRSYVHLLESAVINTCDLLNVKTQRTENPGVWTADRPSLFRSPRTPQKICALGVHLRRNITSHGIGLNVDTEMRWFERIVACGLEGKMTTSLKLENGEELDDLDVEETGKMFAWMMAEELEGVDGEERIQDDGLEDAVFLDMMAGGLSGGKGLASEADFEGDVPS